MLDVEPIPDKPTIEDYPAQAASLTSIALDDSQKNRFNMNVSALRQTADAHPFISNLPEVLAAAGQEYQTAFNAGLFAVDSASHAIHLKMKSFESAVNKEYRYNVVWNRHWPDCPSFDWNDERKWVQPDVWYSTFNDLVRGMLVCRYVDGPISVARALAAHAERLDLEHRYDSRQSDEGYYAYHFYVYLPGQIVDPDFNKVDVTFQVEIQLTTSLQDALRELTQRFYEEQRVIQSDDHGAWKWDVASNRFRASYLGHTLHLLESVILQVKDDSTKDEKIDGR